MKFTELSIQTQRSAPSDIRSEGLVFLYRAGYFSRTGEPLSLGQIAIERLQQSEMQQGSAFISSLHIPTAHAQEDGRVFALHPTGPEELLLCSSCGYAAVMARAHTRREPFSVEEPLPLEKVLTPECSTIAQLAQFMDIPPQKTAKALMFTRLQDGAFIFVVIRGDMQMSEAKLRACLGDFRLASPEEIRASGAVAGYASPVGLKDAVIIVDELVARSANLVAGANEYGYHLKNTNYPRDYLAWQVADLTQALPGESCPDCAGVLEAARGRSIFENNQFLHQNILLSLAEIYHDEKGLSLPKSAAPFDVYLMQVPGKTLDTGAVADNTYRQLRQSGFSVLFDDRDERAGVKFNDADLIGCPVRLTVGERGLQNGMVEVRWRHETENRQIPLDSIGMELSKQSAGQTRSVHS